MSESDDDEDPARKSEIAKTVENCIRVLAEWKTGTKNIPKATAKACMPIAGDHFDQVMTALTQRGIIEEFNPQVADPFHEFNIMPKAVKEWDAIRSRDRVEQKIAWLRSSPWAAGPILVILALIALSTGVSAAISGIRRYSSQYSQV